MPSHEVIRLNVKASFDKTNFAQGCMRRRDKAHAVVSSFVSRNRNDEEFGILTKKVLKMNTRKSSVTNFTM